MLGDKSMNQFEKQLPRSKRKADNGNQKKVDLFGLYEYFV